MIFTCKPFPAVTHYNTTTYYYSPYLQCNSTVSIIYGLSVHAFKNHWKSLIKEKLSIGKTYVAMPKFVNQCMYKCVRKKWAARLVV